MPQPSKATPETVRAAIAALESRGEAVTLQAIRAAIGGGSLATIHPLVRAWRQERAAGPPPTTATGEGSPDAVVPVRVAQTLEAARAALTAIGGSVAEAIMAAVADERRRSRLELDAERQAADRRQAEAEDRVRQAEAETDQLAHDAAEVEAERDRLAARLAEVEAALAVVVAERERLAVRVEGQERRLAELEGDLGQAREGVERLHAAVAEALAGQARTEAELEAARGQLAELRALVDRFAPPAAPTAAAAPATPAAKSKPKPKPRSTEPPPSPPPRPRRSRKAP